MRRHAHVTPTSTCSLDLRPLRCRCCCSLTIHAHADAKFVEMAGGQAVAIHHRAPLSEIRQLHRSLNGVLLPGGNSGPQYSSALSLLVNLTLEAGNGPPGDRVPLLAICLGANHASCEPFLD